MTPKQIKEKLHCEMNDKLRTLGCIDGVNKKKKKSDVLDRFSRDGHAYNGKPYLRSEY